jgi:hypothetical protein
MACGDYPMVGTFGSLLGNADWGFLGGALLGDREQLLMAHRQRLAQMGVQVNTEQMQARQDSPEWDERNLAIQQQPHRRGGLGKDVEVQTALRRIMAAQKSAMAPEPPLVDTIHDAIAYTPAAKWLLAYLALAGALWALGGLF